MIHQKVNYMMILVISAMFKETTLYVSQLYRNINKVYSSHVKLIPICISIINQLKPLTLIKRLQG